MNTESALSFQSQLDSISKLASDGPIKAEQLLEEVSKGLSMLGFEHFAMLTSNNFQVIQQALSTFASTDKFFGRELKSVFEQEILEECFRTRAPVIRPSGMYLKNPFDRVWIESPTNTSCLVLSLYRNRFTYGYFVVFSSEKEHLERNAWRIAAISQLSIDLLQCIPIINPESETFRKEEILVMHWTYQDKTTNEISTITGMTARSVNYHIQNAMRKLDAPNKQRASKIAKEKGLIN